MEIRPPTGPLSVSATPSIDLGKIIATWRAGEVLDATIVAKPSANTVTLTINNVPVTVTAAVPEQWIGTSVKLQVAALTPTVVLKILPTAATLAETSPVPQALREQLPRQLPLPPLLANLQLLSQHSKNFSALLPANVQQAIKQLFNGLPTSQEVSHGSGLARALRDAGQSFEQKLAAATTAPTSPQREAPNVANDFKRGLLQLSQTLQQHTVATMKTATPNATPTLSKEATAFVTQAARNLTPPTAHSTRTAGSLLLPTSTTETALATPRVAEDVEPDALQRRAVSAEQSPTLPPSLKNVPLTPQPSTPPSLTPTQDALSILKELRLQVEGALARVTATQLAQLPQHETPAQQFAVELPVRHGARTDLLDLRFERDAPDRDAAPHQQRWHVTLTFDFPETGPMWAQVRVVGKQVNCTFTAAQPDTAQRIEKDFARLADSLEQAGLDVAKLHCRQGNLARTGTASHHVSLLDIKA